MKVIVTGGCGFIGSHIVDKLVSMNFDIHVIDDLSASENEKFYYNDNAKYYKTSICDIESIEKIFKNTEYVFHLAAESRIQPAIQNPTRAYNINFMGTLNILNLSKKYNIKRVIYSSTSSVYGLTELLPTPEDSDIDCLNPYSHSKFLGEELLRYYNKIHKVESVILRYFNVFGERSPIKGQYAPVVGIFLNQFKNNDPLTIVGDGRKKRDFIHVMDVANANIASMMYKEKFDACVINIGSGENISIKSIANLISDKQIHVPERLGEAENTLAQIDKMRYLLGYECKIHISDWIKMQI